MHVHVRHAGYLRSCVLLSLFTGVGFAQAQLSTLTCSATNVSPGSTFNCTVSLTQAAPGTGALITTYGSTSGVTTPGRITLPAYAISTQFPVTVATNAPAGKVAVSAIYGLLSKKFVVTVGSGSTGSPTAQISGLVCSPSTVVAGSASTCTASLTAPASGSGLALRISATGSGISSPSSIMIPATATSGKFAVATSSSAPSQTAVISATDGVVIKPASLIVSKASALPSAQLSALVCSPTSITAGGAAVCTVSLAASVSTSTAVVLSATGTGVSVPASVTIPAGMVSAQVQLASIATAPAQTAGCRRNCELCDKNSFSGNHSGYVKCADHVFYVYT